MRTHHLKIYPFLVLLIVSLSCAIPVDNPQMTPTPELGLTVPMLEMTATALMNSLMSPESSMQTGTATPGGEVSPESDEQYTEIDPYVEISATALDIVVGESLTITGEPVDIRMPQYEVVLRDEGVQDALPVVSVSYEDQVTPGEGRSQVLELVSVEGGEDRVDVTLRAIAAGVVSVDIIATGEVDTSDGSASVAGMGSGSVLVVVGDE